MYSYTWDTETGGLLLNTSPLQFSKEPRPVYAKELDILGFNKYWSYDPNNDAPYMWAESNTYIYKGRVVARTKGGSLYTRPEIILEGEPEELGKKLEPVNIELMVEKNQEILDTLTQETIKKIYNNYTSYRNKVDVFYVAFSGGKDIWNKVLFPLVAMKGPQMPELYFWGISCRKIWMNIKTCLSTFQLFSRKVLC